MKLSDQLSLINKARKNVKESQTYKDLCKEWQADPDIIDYISICFGDLPVSARTTHGIITLNKSLIEKDLNELSHYIAHEIDHVFSQCLGDKSTKGSSNSEDYLDNPHEIDAFQTQVKFIAETEDQNEAEKYVEKVLKHHDLSGKDKKEKKEELLSEAVNNLLKFIKLASMSLYEALNLFGLSENYTLEEVNNKYKKLIFENHPDRNTSPDAHINTIKIQQAKEVLLSLLKNQRKDKNEEKQENSTEEPVEPVKPVNRENIPNPINLNWEEVDTSWQHKYYTPLDNYTDAEKFEYYTNPEIQKQYEQEFAQEQEYAQEDYEKSKEQEWEYQQDIAYDYSSDLIDKLEILQFPPSKLTDLFGRKRSEEEWKLFNINLSVPSVQNKNKYEKLKERIIHKHIDAFLDFAILKYITENHPDYIKELLLNDFYEGAIIGMEKAGIHSNSIPSVRKELPFQDFVELLSLNKLSIKFLHQRPIDEQIKIINENWNLVLNQLLNNKNILDLTGWNSEEINQLILDKLSSEEPTKQIENIKATILRNIAYKKRSKFSTLITESAKKPFQLSLDFPEPTISKEDVEKFLAELGDDKVQPWRHKRDHQKLGPREKSTRLERLKKLLDSIKKEAGLIKVDPTLIKEVFDWAAGLFATSVRKTQLQKIKEVNISEIEEENSLLGGISAFDDVLSDTKLLKQDLVERYLLVKETNKYQLVESNKKINQKYFESLLVRFYFQDSEEETGSVGSFEDETLELYFDPDFIDSVDEFNSALSEIKRVIIHELGHYYQALGQIENQNLSSSPTQKDKYYLNPDEFYTLLQDEVTFFNRKFENAPGPVKKLAALFWVDSAPKKLKQFSDKLDIYQFTTAKYFKVLKKKDFDRWKKAVKEFMKAINIIE